MPLSLVSVILVVYNKWFFNLSILASGDWAFFLKETLATIRLNYFTAWYGDFFGLITLDVGQAPTWSLYGYLAKYLNLDYAISERIIHFWPVAICTPVFSYLLLKKLFTNKIAVLVGVFVYSFNTYFLLLQAGNLTLMTAFSFAPIILLEYFNTLETVKLKHSLATGLLLFIASAYEPRGFYIIAWVLFLYFLYFIFFLKNFLSKKTFLLGINGLLPLLIVCVLNLYWIIGLSKLTFIGNDIPIGRGLFGSEFYNILYSSTLFHPFWTGGVIYGFIVQSIPIYYWIVPVFALLGLLLHKKNKKIVFFGILAALGIFLSKQIGSPFSGVYPFLYKVLPGFNVFREASKFYFFVALGYSILIASFIDWLWNNQNSRLWYRYVKYIAALIVVIIFLWNTKPLITGEWGGLFVQRRVPSEYVLFNKLILSQQDFFRTLAIPTGSGYVVGTYAHPRADWELFTYVNNTNVNERINNQLKPGELFVGLLNTSYANNLLNESSIKYIVVPLLDPINEDNLFRNYGKPRQFYINELDKISYLHKITLRTKDLVIYENKNYRSLLYVTDKKETIYKDIQYQNIQTQYDNHIEYTFTLKNITHPAYLNFSEMYTPDWKLRVGNFNWYDVLFKKNYFLNNTIHLQTDAKLNSYYLDPQQICQQFTCIKNGDGSYDITLTLYFAPQSYMYLGMVISGVALLIILCSYISILVKDAYAKIN